MAAAVVPDAGRMGGGSGPGAGFDADLKKQSGWKKGGAFGASYRTQFRYVEDEEILADFFKNYSDVTGTPYMKQLKDIKERRSNVFHLCLDDLVNAKEASVREGFAGLPSRIETCVTSYQEHVSNVVDKLLKEVPEPPPGTYEKDTFDFLIEKDEERMSRQGAGASESVPVQFKRRYRVLVRPVPGSAFGETRQVRQMTSECIGKLTVLTGMCISVSPLKPRIQVASYVCDQCNECVYQEVPGMKYTPTTVCPSATCKSNAMRGNLYFEPRASKFVEYQEVRLQELPQHVPKGCVPRSLKVVLEAGAAGKVTAGQVVKITGVLMPDPKTGHAALRASAATRVYYKGFEAEFCKKAYTEILTNDATDRVGFVRSVMDDAGLVEKLVRSVAPEIYGMEDVKKILACQLVGGVNLARDDGMKLRGDLNICLMGDPGVAKSQLLKWVAHMCPRSVFTTGKGSSGVGLTASVTIDEHTKEAVLEGGALVLSDKGVCCIDEFDKMDDEDRTAIHEVMEQQTINIAKGGIITTLNARTSILAAANPRYGRWKSRKTPTQNINLPASLLSRFDVLWLLLDKPDDTRDQMLARHVTSVHMGSVGEQHKERYGLTVNEAMFDKEFIRQFVSYAKTLDPLLDPSVVPNIQDLYCEMRESEQGHDATTYTTPRTLLAILRLSQALTRLRLGTTVGEADVREAARLMGKSKESILESEFDTTSRVREAPVFQVFTILKTQKERISESSFRLDEAREIMAKRRLTEEHLEECLKRYEKNAIVQVTRETGTGRAISVTFI